jgi:hypothetical protein
MVSDNVSQPTCEATAMAHVAHSVTAIAAAIR